MQKHFVNGLMTCVLTTSVLVSPAVAGQCDNAAPRVNVQQANGQIQVQVFLPTAPCEETYGPWMPLDGTTTKYCEYTYKIDGVLQRHYLIWFASAPAHCYCYNRHTRHYWGRWNKGPQTTFTRAVAKAATVTETRFEQSISAPIAPGTQTPMMPPASFPADLPSDVLP